jgi:hypothetical protein
MKDLSWFPRIPKISQRQKLSTLHIANFERLQFKAIN